MEFSAITVSGLRSSWSFQYHNCTIIHATSLYLDVGSCVTAEYQTVWSVCDNYPCNFIVSRCWIICDCRVPDCVKRLWQWTHSYGLSPVWILMCLFRTWLEKKSLPQRLHRTRLLTLILPDWSIWTVLDTPEETIIIFKHYFSFLSKVEKPF